MQAEGNFSQEATRHERVSFSEMSLLESNKLQSKLAEEAYGFFHQGADVPGGSKMLWWIKEGYAQKFGDYIVEHSADRFDVDNEDDRLDLLEALGIEIPTFH
ncbi:MAG: hypothetical protein RLZZ480_143 [Candidatus Parcubacteria bacterium]|jgi:hypothetical protein